VVLVLNLVGCLAFSALAAADRTVKRPAVRPTGSLRGAILFTVGSGVLVYAMCSFLTLSAVNLIGASLTSCFASSNVLFGMVFSVMVIGERPSKRRYVGAVLVAVGCALSALSRKPM
jgi:drug/metabolite transporter (DMT)-like permease